MLASWTADPACAAQLAGLSESCGLDLASLGTDADAATIRDTAVAQPLLVATGVVAAAALDQLLPAGRLDADVVAGHSVGELTAAAVAGVVTPDQAVTIAQVRGQEMAASSVASGSGMAALLGGDAAAVQDGVARLGLVMVNDNGPGHVVVAGPVAALDRLIAARPGRAKVVRLEISGGFHSPELAPVSALLRDLVGAMRVGTPRSLLLSNVDGRVVGSGREAVELIATQVSSPVRWGECMRRMVALGVTGLLELPPAGTLSRIARRGMPEVESFPLDRLDQLDDARAFAVRHLGTAAGAPRTTPGPTGNPAIAAP